MPVTMGTTLTQTARCVPLRGGMRGSKVRGDGHARIYTLESSSILGCETQGWQGAKAVLGRRKRQQYSRQSRLHAVVVRNDVRQAKGRKLDFNAIDVRSSMGEGSFGQVFQGVVTDASSGEERRVVLKRVKTRVSGAQQIAEMEHVLNVYASATCKKSVAPFLGYTVVEENAGKLTAGLWLAWEFEGDRTLAYYLKRRDCLKALAEDLRVPEDDAIPTVMRQLFECLVDLHSAGIVHRDVKPANLVFSSLDKRFKIIDLGAAADLRTGTNYSPSETMLDPCYCAPEEYVLPTDGPDLAQSGAVNFIMSPVLWSRHRPECFDSYSAGVVLLQLALPFMRTNTALKNWKQTMIRLNHDLGEWRHRARLAPRQTALLDANDGLGWDLVEGLLRPREIRRDENGVVKFVSNGSAPRLTPSEALKHPFLKVAAAEKPSAFGKMFGMFSGGKRVEQEVREDVEPPKTPKKSGWAWMQSRVFDLEARISSQANAAQNQTTIVQQLKKDVAEGKTSETELQKAEGTLQSMQQSLKSSVSELRSVFSVARGYLAGPSDVSVSVEESQDTALDEEDIEEIVTEVKTENGKEVNRFLADAASSAIYSSLKFTGRALMAVADLAASAEQSLGEAQAKREMIRKEKAIFTELLARFESVDENSTWNEYRSSVLKILDDSLLTESQMEKTFNAFVGDIAREKRVRLKTDKLNFRSLLVESSITPTSTYATFSKNARKDPRYEALDENIRKEMFGAFVEELSLRAEKDSVSKSLQVNVADMADEQTSMEDLERLRDEQERLKYEYKQMERKLKKMEKLLNLDNLLSDVVEENFMSVGDDGEVTFRFADSKSKKKNTARN